MDQVKIRHPEAGEATVPKVSLPAWQSRGWQQVNEEPEGKDKPRRGSEGKSS